VFLKAKYQFEELPRVFFVSVLAVTRRRPSWSSASETTAHCRIAAAFYEETEQQNKRIGIDYRLEESGLIYNLLNYTASTGHFARAQDTLARQSSYLPKRGWAAE